MVVGNSASEEFVCIRQGKRVGIVAIEIERTRIHFFRHRRRGILNSLIRGGLAYGTLAKKTNFGILHRHARTRGGLTVQYY